MWWQSRIGKAIARVAGRGRGRSGVEQAVFTMVCRLPASKLEATRWPGRDVVVPGIDAVGDDERELAGEERPLRVSGTRRTTGRHAARGDRAGRHPRKGVPFKVLLGRT